MEVVVYIRSHSDLATVAGAAFAALGLPASEAQNDAALGGAYFRQAALGFEATVFANAGDMEDEDFAGYGHALGVVSTYMDPELELEDAEAPLADYLARLLAFHLDAEVATSFYLGGQDGVDLYEIRAFRRNPQWVMDSGPTAQRVYISERRTVEYDADIGNPDAEFDDDADDD